VRKLLLLFLLFQPQWLLHLLPCGVLLQLGLLVWRELVLV
jgi:hypothetical protein